jgi:hypothetical protein
VFNRIFQLLLFACLVTSTVWAANDPFVGKWKVNPSKSKLIDDVKVEAAGPNTFPVTKLKHLSDHCFFWGGHDKQLSF